MSDPCNCDLARSEPLDHKPGEHHLTTCPRYMLGGSAAPSLPATYPVDGDALGEHSSNPREDG